MKIACQHCGIHHVFTAEEILDCAKAIHDEACKRLTLTIPWEEVIEAEKTCYAAYATAVLAVLERHLPEIMPPSINTLTKEAAAGRNFKAYVHERLDAMGVEKDPAPGDSCRIGKRLDIVAHTMHRMAGLDK